MLEAIVNGLFRRWPALLGFSVQDAGTFAGDRESAQIEGELCLADVEAHASPRTFARTLH